MEEDQEGFLSPPQNRVNSNHTLLLISGDTCSPDFIEQEG